MNNTNPQVRVFAAQAAGAVWWTLDQLLRYGPRWELVPPLLMGAASLLGALKVWLDGAQARRHAEEKHQREMSCILSLPLDSQGAK